MPSTIRSRWTGWHRGQRTAKVGWVRGVRWTRWAGLVRAIVAKGGWTVPPERRTIDRGSAVRLPEGLAVVDARRSMRRDGALNVLRTDDLALRVARVASVMTGQPIATWRTRTGKNEYILPGTGSADNGICANDGHWERVWPFRAGFQASGQCLYRSMDELKKLGAGMTLSEQVCHRPEEGSIGTDETSFDPAVTACMAMELESTEISQADPAPQNKKAEFGEFACPRARLAVSGSLPNAKDYRGGLMPMPMSLAPVCAYQCTAAAPAAPSSDPLCHAAPSDAIEASCGPPSDWWCR